MGSSTLAAAIFCAYLLCLANATLPKTSAELKREILDQILPKHHNEILVSPGNSTSSVTQVEVFIHVLDIEKVDEQKMEFTIRLFVRQSWKDYRLKYDNKDQFKYIGISDPDVIWTPDIFFSNERVGHGHDIVNVNSFIRIFPNGAVLFSKKVTLTVSCDLDLRKLPFDRQECSLRLESYGMTTDNVMLIWRDYVPVTVNRLIQIQLFELDRFTTSSEIVRVNTGDYSVLSASFYLIRTLNYYWVQVFIPSIMFVIISWLPFWMNKKLLIGRLLINLGTLFTYSLIAYDFNQHQAKMTYTTRLQHFMGTCMTFLFISLLETLLVQAIEDKDTKAEAKDCATNGEIHNGINGKLNTVKAWIAKLPKRTNCVDLAARIIIPLMFLIFCSIYFSSARGNNGPVLVQGNRVKEGLLNSTRK